jgi:hypothetical protein
VDAYQAEGGRRCHRAGKQGPCNALMHRSDGNGLFGQKLPCER